MQGIFVQIFPKTGWVSQVDSLPSLLMNSQVTHGDPPVRRLRHVLTQSVLRHPRGKSAFGAFLGMTLPGFIIYLFIF